MTTAYRLREQHQYSPSRCDDYHCFAHNVDEIPIGKPYRYCGECFHLFQTAHALKRDRRRVMRPIYLAELWELIRHPRTYSSTGIRQQVSFVARSITNLFTRRARNIYVCPHCAHDF